MCGRPGLAALPPGLGLSSVNVALRRPRSQDPSPSVQVRCPLRTTSTNTLSTPWRSTRTQKLLRPALVRVEAGPEGFGDRQ